MRSSISLAFRRLRRDPAFAIAAIATLALGIGATTAMFSVVDAVLIRPLSYHAPERIVAVWRTTPQNRDASHAPADFLDLKRDNQVFANLAGYREDVFDVVSGSAAVPQRIEGAQVTSAFFDVFGVQAIAGRTLQAGQDEPTGPRVAVLSERAWTRFFNRDPATVGKTVRINGGPVTIIGIVPASFEWPSRDMELWALTEKQVPSPPLEIEGDLESKRGVSYFEAVAQLRPGITMADAQANVDTIAKQLEKIDPENNTRRGYVLVPIHEQVVGKVRAALLMLTGAVGLVLLIASANVAGLLLARAATRRREMGLRAALGASRQDLFRQLIGESVLLSVIGAVSGVLVARLGVLLLIALAPESSVPRLADAGMDFRVLAFAATVALVTAVLFGAAPAADASRVDLVTALRDGERGASGRSHRLRALLVVAEVAMALVILVGAGLLLNSFTKLTRVDPGFDATRVVAVELPLPQARYPTPAAQMDFYTRVIEQLKARPDFTVAAVFPAPMTGGTNSGAPVRIVGKPEPDPGDVPRALLGTATPGVFKALGVRMLEGRDFTDADRDEAPLVAIVSAEAARRYWPGENPMGSSLTLGGAEAFTVVGIVGDVRRRSLDIAPEPTIYLSARQLSLPFLSVLVRTTASPEAIVNDVRAAVRRVDPELPVGEARTLAEIVSTSVAEPRFRTTMVTIFSAAALLLAAVGLYGLISYSVAQRSREMGIRLALGAHPGQVLRLAMREGVALAAIGVVIGVLAALPLMRLLGSLLFGIGAADPGTYLAVAAMLIGVAVLACYVPARRAASVDPMVTLRAD